MKRSLVVSSLLKCHLQRLFHHFSPGWFVCCRPSPRESWNYRFPSAELGKHLFSDRNGSRYWLKPVTKKGARWETMYFNSSFTFHFIWQPCFTDAPADFGLHRLRRYSDHSPVWFILFIYLKFCLLQSQFLGVSLSGQETHPTILRNQKQNMSCWLSQSQDAHQNDSAAHLQIVPITHSFKRTASRHRSDITDSNGDDLSIKY